MARQYTSAQLVAAVSEAGALGIPGCLDRPAHHVFDQSTHQQTVRRELRPPSNGPRGVRGRACGAGPGVVRSSADIRATRRTCPPSRRRHDSPSHHPGRSSPSGGGWRRRDGRSGRRSLRALRKRFPSDVAAALMDAHHPHPLQHADGWIVGRFAVRDHPLHGSLPQRPGDQS